MTKILKNKKFLWALILVIWILPRIWSFGALPAGLHQDETANGVDAYDVLYYHVDRTGIRYPIQFISWGSGQSTLYAYSTIPFIWIGDLNAITVRLPNLLAGILILPLIFLAGKKILNEKLGFIAMFFTAISPWNIMGSRWGLEAYFVPLIFLLGFTCYLYAEKSNHWFILGSFFFGLALYAYSTTFVVVPLFVLLSLIFLLTKKRLSIIDLIIGLGVLAIIAIPMILFVVINSFELDPIRILKLTIPRLPTLPRYETTVSIFKSNPINAILVNLKLMAGVLWTGDDGLVWNRVLPYGYFYPFAIIPGLIGFIVSVFKYKKSVDNRSLLIGFWFFAALLIGLLQPANIHRLSLLYIPLILGVAYFLAIINLKSLWILIGILAIYFAMFVGFVGAYFSPAYQDEASKFVNYDLVSAIQYSKGFPDHQVCLSDKIHEAYIYVLYVEKPDPDRYLIKTGYVDRDIPFKRQNELSKYKFFMDNCDPSIKTVYILTENDDLSTTINAAKMTEFGFLKVLVTE